MATDLGAGSAPPRQTGPTPTKVFSDSAHVVPSPLSWSTRQEPCGRDECNHHAPRETDPPVRQADVLLRFELHARVHFQVESDARADRRGQRSANTHGRPSLDGLRVPELRSPPNSAQCWTSSTKRIMFTSNQLTPAPDRADRSRTSWARRHRTPSSREAQRPELSPQLRPCPQYLCGPRGLPASARGCISAPAFGQ